MLVAEEPARQYVYSPAWIDKIVTVPLVQAAAPVLKVGQQTSVRHVFSSVVS